VQVRLAGGELAVRDHGPGVAADDQPHVFDRFYRASAARAVPGSGLGLSIVRQVAHDHGGTIRLHAPGNGGTLLRLTLPVRPVPEPEPVRPAPELVRPAPEPVRPAPEPGGPAPELVRPATGPGGPVPGPGESPPVTPVAAEREFQHHS
jgi:two-component system sensor histidine kinase MprB